jgi:hypothetical protein
MNQEYVLHIHGKSSIHCKITLMIEMYSNIKKMKNMCRVLRCVFVELRERK